MKIYKRIVLIIGIVLVAVLYAYGSWGKGIYDVNIGSNSYLTTEVLSGTDEVNQTFVCPYNGFDSIAIKIQTYEKNNIGDYNWRIENLKTDEVMGEGTLTLEDINKKGFAKLKFDRIGDSKNVQFRFILAANNVEEQDGISLYMTEKGAYAKELALKSEKSNYSTIIKILMTRFNVETFIVFLGLVLYVTIFIRFMYKLFK